MKKSVVPLRLSKSYLYGLHAVREALSNPKRRFKNLYLTAEALETFQPSMSFKTISKEQLNLALGDDTVHQGIVLETEPLAPLHLEDLIAQAPATCHLLILDQISDPHNVGAIARSAAAFGTYAVIQQDKNAPDMTSPIIAKVASGGLEHVPFAIVANLSRAINQLQQNNFWVIGLDECGEQPLSAVSLTGRLAFVMGREGKGLRRLVKENCDQLVYLPTNPQFPTLNVSNAAAITLYEWARQNQGK